MTHHKQISTALISSWYFIITIVVDTWTNKTISTWI